MVGNNGGNDDDDTTTGGRSASMTSSQRVKLFEVTMFERIKTFLKGAVKSWTVWCNGVGAAVVGWIVMIPDALPSIKQSFPELQPYLSGKAFKYGMLAILVGNIVLRIKTTKSLSEKGGW